MKLHLAKSQDLPPGIELDPGFSLISATSTDAPDALEATLASKFPAIRAGLSKLVNAEAVVLDLSALPASALTTARNRVAIQELARWGSEQTFELLLVLGNAAAGSSGPSFANASEALLFARSPLQRLERKERSLRARIAKIEAQKSALQAQLGALEGPGQEIRRLRQETTEFKRKVARLQPWSDTEGRARAVPYRNPALDAKRQAVTELLRSLFAQGESK